MDRIAMLKKKSQQSFEKISKSFDKPRYQGDSRLWRFSVDKSGKVKGKIRFLPNSFEDTGKNKDIPYVRLFSYFFKNEATGKWFIEDSPTTIGLPDPVAEHNATLNVENRITYMKQKRRISYISNILVVADPEKPKNEGKVFLFRYGREIYEMIRNLIQPDEDAVDMQNPVNPFDLFEGATFQLAAVSKNGYWNYDGSKFEKPNLLGTNEEILAVEKQLYSLSEFLDPKRFKSYEELKTLYEEVAKGSKDGSRMMADLKSRLRQLRLAIMMRITNAFSWIL